jgi:S-adenosylmethionine-diacylglycerol 3-amino-3-carboxypropyl transferase
MVLKFAVVREDSNVERVLCQRLVVQRVLTVASGGCTALTLAADGLDVTAFDVNSAQLAHVRSKAEAVAAGDLRALNVEDADAQGLNQRGAFEGLFRLLRSALTEFVIGGRQFEEDFSAVSLPAEAGMKAEDCFGSPYWAAAFTTAFNEDLLHAMFGRAATQHAIPGSYPGYFRTAFERGLRRPDARRNPFLQHVLLGYYRAADAPAYTGAGRRLDVDLFPGSLTDVSDLGRYQLYGLSNVFDWSDDELVGSWAERLKRDAPRRSAVLMRQLNNRRDLRAFFEPEFVFDEGLASSLLASDRSLFYERIEVGIRR